MKRVTMSLLVGGSQVALMCLTGGMAYAQSDGTSLSPVMVDAPTPRRPARAIRPAARTTDPAARRPSRQTARRDQPRAPVVSPAPAGPAPAPGEATASALDPAQRGYQPVLSSVASLSEKSFLDVPQSVAVVTNQVIRDQQVRTLDEALYNVSGVTQTNTLGGTQDAFIRRGFGDNRDGSVLRDGLRTALPRSFGATTERVEVLKGPASALYGILDPGGLINIVSKTPRFVQANLIEVAGTTLNGKAGGAVRMDLTGPVSGTNVAYRLVAEHAGEEYWRSFGNLTSQVIAPSLAWRGDTTAVTLGYEYSAYKVPFDRGTIFDPRTGRAVRVPGERRFDMPYNVTRGESHLATAHVSQLLGDNWRLNFDYAFSSNWYNDRQARVVTFFPANGNLTRRADATQDSRFDVHSARLNATGRYDVLGTQHELLVGGTYDYSSVLRTNLIRGPNQANQFNIYNPVYDRLPASTNVVATDSDQQERIGNAAVFLQDSVTLMDRLILVGGVSFQQYEDKAGRGRPFNLNTNAEGSATIPRVGLIYKVTDAVSLFALHSQSFRPNSNIATSAGSLPPEEGDSYEGGIKVETPNGVTATFTYYDIDKKNVQYTTTGIVNGALQNIVKTAGRVGSSGVEFDVAGRLTDRLSVIGSFGYTDALVLSDPDTTILGKRLPNVAVYTASAFLTYDFGAVLDGNLRAGIGGRMQSRRAGDPQNTFFMPLYTVADAFVAWDTLVQGYRTTVQLNVKNLFDAAYYTSSIGNGNLGIQVGEPLRAVLSARVEF